MHLVTEYVWRCRTLTAPVELNKCLKAIKDHAFTASEYPVVITFEDHLTHDLRQDVAEVSNRELTVLLGLVSSRITFYFCTLLKVDITSLLNSAFLKTNHIP